MRRRRSLLLRFLLRLPLKLQTHHHMIDLRKIFTNWFKDPAISFTELLKYAARHLQLMIANNPGALLNERINATTIALSAVEAGVTDVTIKAAIQKGKTEAKKTFREVLPENIRKIHAAVVAVYGDPSPDLTECFPEGRGVFGSCRDEQLNNKLAPLVAALTPRADQIGQVHVDNAGGLVSTWTAIFAAQDAAMAQKSMMAGSRDAAKAQLQLALYLNVLRLAMAFPDQPEKCDLYCPQQYLKNAQAGEEEEPPTPPGP
jgi:uncharacterized protein with beta-barrel porin domain